MTLSPQELTVLGRCPLLRGCADTLPPEIAGAREASLLAFSPGQTVYSPQRFSRCLGVLLSGRLHVSKGALSVSILEPGELFGAAALYSDAPEYATTIIAKRSGRCLLLEQGLVDCLLAGNPLVRDNYLRYLTGRIRFLSGRLQSLSQSGVEGKLARYLLANSKDGSLTCPAISLAKSLGISRASLYRAFELLQESGLIVRRGKTIAIPSLSALEGAL